ncbi:hypothetical protein QT971_31430, partial [Microcoleus sp. herbarium19]|uniref:hypothetical protein n=1 Tax=Microcoleus sp. herbarium19 TaxID=3055440 RepID=UPI002FD297DD
NYYIKSGCAGTIGEDTAVPFLGRQIYCRDTTVLSLISGDINSDATGIDIKSRGRAGFTGALAEDCRKRVNPPVVF